MLRDEIVPFIDANGLVAPNLPAPVGRGSDNGVCFTSEYYLILNRHRDLNLHDLKDYSRLMNSCIDTELRRAPDLKGTDEVDETDDYHGVFAARNVLGLTKEISLSLPLRLYRQPQLLFLSVAHKYRWYKPHYLPLLAYTALVIATSCMTRPASDTDSRRLSWLLIEGTYNSSFLIRFASSIWYKRLHKDYGLEPMKRVASIYYHRDNHPFKYYWPSDLPRRA